jgi:hypothetical protein
MTAIFHAVDVSSTLNTILWSKNMYSCDFTNTDQHSPSSLLAAGGVKNSQVAMKIWFEDPVELNAAANSLQQHFCSDVDVPTI